MFTLKTHLTSGLLTMALVAVAAHGAQAESTADKIARAKTAAPASITDHATISDADGTILQQGTNGWVCFPGIPLMPGDDHPMCNDPVWMKWLAVVSAGTEFSTDVPGISYMLAGDANVNNANPMATDPNDGGVWVMEGPHIMVLYPSRDMVADLTRDPYVGGPYVMWDETPLWHVMIPLGERSAP